MNFHILEISFFKSKNSQIDKDAFNMKDDRVLLFVCLFPAGFRHSSYPLSLHHGVYGQHKRKEGGMTPVKVLWIVLGTLSLTLGAIGVVVPGLPTTAFLLLAAWLYLKSSPRLYQKLISNRYLGPYILDFQQKKGMTKRTKLHAIGTMWVMITISCVFFIQSLAAILIVIGLGIIGTVVMGFIVRTVDP
jgi:uncharacterized membrane protein YbaN (DUF454 family)